MFFDKLKIPSTIFVLLYATIVGCTTLQMREYQEGGSWSVLTIKERSRKKIVDNFSKNNENQLSGKNSFSSPYIKGRYKKDGAFNAHGRFLEISYKLNAGEKAFWESDLNKLDVSQAQALSFWIRLDDAWVRDNVHIALVDASGNNVTLPLRDFPLVFSANKEWYEIIIPRRLFGLIDFNSLTRLQFIVTAEKDGALTGSIGIDGIVFVGDKNLYFASLKDNLFGFPRHLLDTERKRSLLKKADNDLLRAVAEDTWKNISSVVDKKSFLPLDSIKVDEEQWVGDYTSPTNIGLFLIACVGAYEMGFITKDEAIAKTSLCINVLERLSRWHGFHYNYYNTTTLQATSRFISTVDCAWLAAGLIVARQAWGGEIAKTASRLLDVMDFSRVYDENIGQLRIGYDNGEKKLSPYHYGLFATEARIASLIAIGKGDIPQEHWFRVYRTLPREWDWQSQVPDGSEKTYLGHDVFAGYYTYKDKKIVPSWGGSLFEFLMPTLVVNEKKLSPRALGLNNITATQIHIDYALNERQYKVWGLSPCSVPGKKYGSYGEFGIPELGAKGYTCAGIVTPYASFLALDVMPDEALMNIRNLLAEYDLYGEYGFYDSVILADNKVSYRYLVLDQSMIFIAIVNYLKSDIIKDQFHSDSIIKNAEHLLSMETFFE